MLTAGSRQALVGSGELAETAVQADTTEDDVAAAAEQDKHCSCQRRQAPQGGEPERLTGRSRCLALAGGVGVFAVVFVLGGFLVPPAVAAVRGDPAAGSPNATASSDPPTDHSRSRSHHSAHQRARANGMEGDGAPGQPADDIWHCKDSAINAPGNLDSSCVVYEQHPSACSEESGGDAEFSPLDMCCACGGGTSFVVGAPGSIQCPEGSAPLTALECQLASSLFSRVLHEPFLKPAPSPTPSGEPAGALADGQPSAGCFVLETTEGIHYGAEGGERTMPYCRNTSADEKNSSGKANASASGGAEKSSSNANTSAHKAEKSASSEEKASSEEDSPDGESGAGVCKDCEWAGKGELCGKQQDDGSHCWSYCCNRTLLHKILDFGSTEGLFERAPMKRCALIGAADSLSGQGKGAEIDEHDTVIRINRLPTSQFFHDVGEKTTVYFASDKVMRLWGAIPMMGSSEENDNGLAWQCNEMNQCMHAALIFNSDGEEPCPLEELQEAFGDGHPLISCVNPMVKELTWRFKAVLEKPATTGFMTFVTMAALCEELDVYGFQGSGTTDGHVEWADHPLEAEHAIEHFIAEGDWDSCDLQYDWKGWVNEGMKKFWPWYQDNVAKIEFRG